MIVYNKLAISYKMFRFSSVFTQPQNLNRIQRQIYRRNKSSHKPKKIGVYQFCMKKYLEEFSVIFFAVIAADLLVEYCKKNTLRNYEETH